MERKELTDIVLGSVRDAEFLVNNVCDTNTNAVHFLQNISRYYKAQDKGSKLVSNYHLWKMKNYIVEANSLDMQIEPGGSIMNYFKSCRYLYPVPAATVALSFTPYAVGAEAELAAVLSLVVIAAMEVAFFRAKRAVKKEESKEKKPVEELVISKDEKDVLRQARIILKKVPLADYGGIFQENKAGIRRHLLAETD